MNVSPSRLTRTFTVIFMTMLWSCSDTEKQADQFFETYKEIVSIRSDSTLDSLQYVQKIQDILHKHGYTNDEAFRSQFKNFAQDAKKMKLFLDSLQAIDKK